MAKTKSAKSSSAGKSKTKVAAKKPVKKPAKPVTKNKPASAKPKAASGKKPVVKFKAKPVAKKAAKPVKKPAAKPVANKAKPKAVPAAKPVAKQKAAVGKTGTNLASISKVPKAVPVSPNTKPSKTAPTMSSKQSAIAKPASPKAPSIASKNPAPGAGIASPLQAATKGFVPYVMQKGEEYMNEKQKEHFRKILLNRRDELMQEVDRTVHHMQDEAANPPDPADRATLEEEFSLELRTRDRERRLIKKIDSTIELIANDDYGYCDSCGVEIGIRRLEARPTASKCIDCKTLDEIKEKQIGSA